MSEEEEDKFVHISMREEDMENPEGETKSCKDCGKTVVVSGNNIELESGESVEIEDVDEFLCQVCGAKKVRKEYGGGVAG